MYTQTHDIDIDTAPPAPVRERFVWRKGMKILPHNHFRDMSSDSKYAEASAIVKAPEEDIKDTVSGVVKTLNGAGGKVYVNYVKLSVENNTAWFWLYDTDRARVGMIHVYPDDANRNGIGRVDWSLYTAAGGEKLGPYFDFDLSKPRVLSKIRKELRA